MLLLNILLATVFLSVPVFGTPVTSSKVVHEKRSTFATTWNKHRRLESRAIVPIRVGLKQSNVDQVSDLLHSVSDPASTSYGRHWPMNQIVDFFAPHQTTISEVKAWLESEGFGPDRVRLSASKGWLEFKATAAEAERLLDTEFHIYQNSNGHESIGCDEYSVPAHVKHHIDLITPTVNTAMKRTSSGPVKRSTSKPNAFIRGPKTNGKQVSAAALPADLSTCDTMIVPDCLRALYNIDRIPTETKKNTFAVVEFTTQSYVQSDLNMFFANFSPSIQGTSPILVSIDGGVPTPDTLDGFGIDAESDLDFQYAMSLTAPQPVQLYQTGDGVANASFNTYLDAIDKSFCTFEGGGDPVLDGSYPDPLPGGFKGPESCGIVKPANVISVSYSGNEADYTVAYFERTCIEHGKLGLAGVSILYSSGDDGVAGGGECLTANGTDSATGTRFNPGFPVTCPFVTAVGATQIDPGNTVDDPEGACEQVIFSGGGFSNVFALPSYQEKAVKSFFAQHPPPYTAAQFNNSQATRGYPDLAANGANYVIALDGEFQLVFGTSASTPVVSSMITLINDARIKAGKGPVGFINPAIYSASFASAFNDITHGGNQGCGTPGFTAVTGWDPVTGLGTPNFSKLLKAFMALP